VYLGKSSFYVELDQWINIRRFYFVKQTAVKIIILVELVERENGDVESSACFRKAKGKKAQLAFLKLKKKAEVLCLCFFH